MSKDDNAHTRRTGEVLASIELEEPIHSHGEELDRLDFRKVRARDLRVIDEEPGEVGQTIALLAKMTDTTPEAIDELTLDDFEQAAEVMERFFGKFAKRRIKKPSTRPPVSKAGASKRSGRRSQG